MLSVQAWGEENFDRGLDAYLEGNYAQAYQVWRPLADAGDKIAMFNIGVLYAQGKGVKQDMPEAVKWYRRSAEAGYAPAQFNLGSSYLDGRGVDIDKQRALEWWTRAAAQDHPRSLFNLATLYLQGNGVDKDRNKALELYRRAADQGDTRARELVERLSAATDTKTAATKAADRPAEQATAKAAKKIDERPEEEAAEASVVKTPAYKPVEKSAEQVPEKTPEQPAERTPEKPVEKPAKKTPPKRLEETVEQSAEKPADQAAVEDTATGSETEALKGEDWIRRQNPDHVTLQLAVYSSEKLVHKFVAAHRLDRRRVAYLRVRQDDRDRYKLIFGVFTDAGKAEAARTELPPAIRSQRPWIRPFAALHAELGQQDRAIEEHVRGASSQELPVKAPAAREVVKKEVVKATATATSDASLLAAGQKAFNAQQYTKAIEIWQPLAVRGLPEAQYNLGFMYESGWGLERDPKRAAEWYRFAAEQGFAKAQFNLGVLYMEGRGVDKNKGLGLYWIQSAADRDDKRATNYIKDYHARR